MNRNRQRHSKKTEKHSSINYGEFFCVSCGKQITEITQALTEPETGQPIHFDCAHQEILKQEELPERAELIYLGKGTFGIVQFENPRNRKHFTILKTIAYEIPTEEENWRTKVKDEFEKTFDE